MEDKYVFKNEGITVKKTVYIILLTMVISGFFGFIYETIFYRIDLGYFVKRGSTFGPWVPIYAFGGAFIVIFTYRLKNSPILLFFTNCLLTGVLEYGTGYFYYEFLGKRLWDYNTEIWNFGNINGYICLRSILLFGISSLFLIYVVIPILKKKTQNISEKKLAVVSVTLGMLFFLDVIAYMIIK